MINLNPKEMNLLQDQIKHEELCIKKYAGFAAGAQDPQLKQLFEEHKQQEQQHLNTLNQLLCGQMPPQQADSQQSASPSAQPAPQPFSQEDADMCEDLLATEKYVSGTYDTAIFEFRDAGVRQILNHIQKEEQQHGEQIYNYMAANGMYQA